MSTLLYRPVSALKSKDPLAVPPPAKVTPSSVQSNGPAEAVRERLIKMSTDRIIVSEVDIRREFQNNV
jgi:hypothetical protein